MILKMFAIYDVKSEIHHPPSFAHTVGHALRTFKTIFSKEDLLYFQYPDDFQVFEVGCFDDLTGEICGCKRHLICSGRECMAALEPGELQPEGIPERTVA